MKTLFLILQITCIVLVTAGIFIEYNFQADLGFIFITAGAFAFALGEKFDKYRIKRDLRNSQQLNNKNHE